MYQCHKPDYGFNTKKELSETPPYLHLKGHSVIIIAQTVNLEVRLKQIYIYISFTIKPTRCTNFSNLFWKLNSTCFGMSSVHHQELFTVHSSSSRIRMELQFHPDPAAARKLSTNLYDI
jgi:hypothetical protein